MIGVAFPNHLPNGSGNHQNLLKEEFKSMTNDLDKIWPSLTKGAIGFDDLVNRIKKFNAGTLPTVPTYPPYNIKKTDENTYVIEVALAGFSKNDITLELRDSTLVISGSIKSNEQNDYIFNGIADRAFTHRFTLADTIEVKNADLINGMLKIWLEKFIPESSKPKIIDINDGSETKSKKKDVA